MLGRRFCARAFSSCGKRGPLFIAVHGPYTIAVSLVADNRFQTRRLSNCGSRAQLLCGMWDLPRPGLEPVFPALAGRLSTTAPPGKPLGSFLTKVMRILQLKPALSLSFSLVSLVQFPPLHPSLPAGDNHYHDLVCCSSNPPMFIYQNPYFLDSDI